MTAQYSCFHPYSDRFELIPGVYLGRRWHLSSPHWSRGSEASIVVQTKALRNFAQNMPQPDMEFGLTLSLSMFQASPDLPGTITIKIPGQKLIEKTVTSTDSYDFFVPLNAAGLEGDHQNIQISTSYSASPLSLGLSLDERILGTCLRNVKWQYCLKDFPLDFSLDYVCQSTLGNGWGPYEDNFGCWSLGEVAQLMLPAIPASSQNQAQVLTMDVGSLPRPSDTAPLTLNVMLDGQNISTHELSHTGETLIDIPLPEWPENTPLPLEFVLGSIMSPSDLEINEDTRELGIVLRSIAV